MEQADRVYAAIMAAGESKRFGAQKQLVEFTGESLVRRACRVVRTACGTRSLLVLGHNWQGVLESSCHPYFVINEDYRSGLGGSISAAARALRHTATGLLVTLADQVRVTSDDLERLLALHRKNPEGITIARYADTVGPPVIFPAGAFGDLESQGGSQGAKSVIDSGRYPIATLDCDNARIDIDTPADLRALEQPPESGRG